MHNRAFLHVTNAVFQYKNDKGDNTEGLDTVDGALSVVMEETTTEDTGGGVDSIRNRGSLLDNEVYIINCCSSINNTAQFSGKI